MAWIIDREIHEPIRIAVFERLQQNAANQRKHGGVATDAEGKSQERRNRENGSLAKRAQGIAQILTGGFEKGDTVQATDVFANESGIAELPEGRSAGCVRRHTAHDVVFRFGSDIKLDIASAFGVAAGAAKEA